jgi:hypothetical protein
MKFGKMPDFSKIPGRVEVELQTYRKGDANFQTRDRSGQVLHADPGYTVRHFREMIGGDEGYVRDPYRGDKHFVSLKGHTVDDLDNTKVHLRFKFIPAQRRAGSPFKE